MRCVIESSSDNIEGSKAGRVLTEMLTIIKPVPKAVKTILYEIFCGAKVEPWIDYDVYQRPCSRLVFPKLSLSQKGQGTDIRG